MMKKIAIVCKDISTAGGAERMALQLINAIKDEYNIHLIVLHGSGGERFFDLCPDVPVHVLDDGCFERIRETYKKCRKSFRKLIKENGYDYVILEATYTNFLGVAMGFGLHTKFIVCDHGSIKSQLGDKSITFLRRISAHLAYRVVVLTESSKRAYEEIFRTKKEKLRCIYNWIEPEELSNEYSYPAESKCIISVGRFAPEKKFETIPEIAKQVFGTCPDWQWHIYGDGEYMDRVKEAVEKAGLQDNVILMGQRSDVGMLYRNYSFYVMTSCREGLPLVLLEAKANHLPIVSYDIETGPDEIITDGVNGFLVENQNIQMMAGRISTLIEEKSLRQEFAAHAYDDINKFSKEKILLQWREVLK
jgi:glycosyltransferase involved in cell wall biosynthesis